MLHMNSPLTWHTARPKLANPQASVVKYQPWRRHGRYWWWVFGYLAWIILGRMVAQRSHIRIWQRHMLVGMADFWLSAMDNTATNRTIWFHAERLQQGMKLSLITLPQLLETNTTIEQHVLNSFQYNHTLHLERNPLPNYDRVSWFIISSHRKIHHHPVKKTNCSMGLQYTSLTLREIKYKTSLILLPDSHRPVDQSSTIANSTCMPPDA